MKQLASIIKSNRFILLLLVWGMIDLLCAMLCDIHADEAYYRLYGQYLDWGYFDHPPMIALMTFISDVLVPGTSIVAKNLSVRLMTVLFHMATVFLVWKTLDIKDRTDKRAQNITNESHQSNHWRMVKIPPIQILSIQTIICLIRMNIAQHSTQ